MLNTLFLLFCPALSVCLRTRVFPDTGDVKPNSFNTKHTHNRSTRASCDFLLLDLVHTHTLSFSRREENWAAQWTWTHTHWRGVYFWVSVCARVCICVWQSHTKGTGSDIRDSLSGVCGFGALICLSLLLCFFTLAPLKSDNVIPWRENKAPFKI